jgi:hypothetical protein
MKVSPKRQKRHNKLSDSGSGIITVTNGNVISIASPSTTSPPSASIHLPDITSSTFAAVISAPKIAEMRANSPNATFLPIEPASDLEDYKPTQPLHRNLIASPPPLVQIDGHISPSLESLLPTYYTDLNACFFSGTGRLTPLFDSGGNTGRFTPGRWTPSLLSEQLGRCTPNNGRLTPLEFEVNLPMSKEHTANHS